MGLLKNLTIYINHFVEEANKATTPDAEIELKAKFDDAEVQLRAYSAQVKVQMANLSSLLDQKMMMQSRIETCNATAQMAAADNNEQAAKESIKERLAYEDRLIELSKEIESQETAVTELKKNRELMFKEFNKAKTLKDSFMLRLGRATADNSIADIHNDFKELLPFENGTDSTIGRLKKKVFIAEADRDMRKSENDEGAKMQSTHTFYKERARQEQIDREYQSLRPSNP